VETETLLVLSGEMRIATHSAYRNVKLDETLRQSTDTEPAAGPCLLLGLRALFEYALKSAKRA
jgi:hypothetical protein